MALETFNYIDSLNTANPTATDNVSEGDDHIRGIKTTLKNTFPNVNAAVSPTDEELNYVDGVTSAIQTQLDAKQATISSLTSTGAELNVVDMSASGSTSGQLLTSNGTGSVATWQAAPQGVSNSKLFYFGSFN